MDKKIYNLKVTLGDTGRKKIYRKIELKGATTLFHFAEAIIDAFDFQFDHSFGFYDNIKNIYESYEVYTLFFDSGVPVVPNEQSVKQNHVYNVFEPKKKMVFLFDYGDDWMFLVECLGIAEPKPGKRYPMVTEKKGKAPPQYPDCDE